MFCIRLLSAVFLTLLLCAPAHARDAEDDRISREIESRAKRGAWEGVEELLAQLEQPSAQDLLTGAQAARHHGDLTLTRERLEAAVTAGDDEQAAQWLQQLYAQTRPVVLDGARTLNKTPPPFNPDHVSALKLVNERLTASAHFVGLLPLGRYKLDGQAIDVPAGSTVLKFRVQPKEPEPLTPASTPVATAPAAPPSPAKRTIARPLLLAIAGSFAATSAGLYATGASRRSSWASATDVRDVHNLRSETNRYTTLSGITLGAALGLGATGVIVR